MSDMLTLTLFQEITKVGELLKTTVFYSVFYEEAQDH